MNVLELSDVNKVYGAGSLAVHAVCGVTLQVRKGELLIVMGPSGAGKTTLLLLMGALLSPSSGEIYLNERKLANLSASQLARVRLREIGFIFQTFNLFSALTALDNVALPAALAGTSRHTRLRRSAELLRQLGLERALHRLPEQLSGGEKQRVAVARALVNDPPLILADEPTANLDSVSGYRVIQILREIASSSDRTIVVVTHDHRIVDAADRLLWLQDGALYDHEPTALVVSDPVCGAEVLVERAATTRGHVNRTYYFCSQLCAQRFDRAPALYAREPAVEREIAGKPERMSPAGR